MSYDNAFEMSPVPTPSAEAVAPEPFRGIYGMPMFNRVFTTDAEASREFWTRGLGFFDLFSIPGTLTHLRRWAFQDVLLVPAPEQMENAPSMIVSFACVMSEIDQIAAACIDLRPGCTDGPRETPWNTIDLEVITPENARVVMTAGRPLDPEGEAAASLHAMGFLMPDQEEAAASGTEERSMRSSAQTRTARGER